MYEYYEYPAIHMVRKNRGIRTKKWKYIRYFEDSQEFELFDLENDPHEMDNLINNPSYKEIIEQLKARMLELRRELKDPDS